MTQHRLERLEVKNLGAHADMWAGWWCSCGETESGLRWRFDPGGPLVGAANDWGRHSVKENANEIIKRVQVIPLPPQ